MVLVRGLLGDVLRRRRLRQGRTLREVSADARVSLGYLSEIERGQKEASSELLASICTALDVPLSAVFAEVSEDLAREEAIVRETALVDKALVDTPPLVLTHPTAEQDVVASAA
ncbi:MAG TPA: helix-turn-helix domain-containing protein [Kribbellaceae bacterium]|nr:helix-turn-helix domain-containing protein [Kribbellaceae bacterium]